MLACLATVGLHLDGAVSRRLVARSPPVAMSLNPADWQLLMARDGSEKLQLEATDPAYAAQEVRLTVPRTAGPSLGLLLEEIAASDEAGIVAVEGLVESGNGELASAPIEPGDALVSAAEAGRPETAVSLEGLAYDGVIERLVALDSNVGVEFVFKRLVRMPRAAVRIQFPESEGREEEVIYLQPGANLRRTMLASGIKLNDPLARRFDAGVGTGDCGGEGTCCTCVFEVASGGKLLSPQGTQEAQILKRFPRWRLACKATLDPLERDEELVIKVTPRAFDGFYGDEEVDVDGEPLARDTAKK